MSGTSITRGTNPFPKYQVMIFGMILNNNFTDTLILHERKECRNIIEIGHFETIS
jgi:hypothetical protein